jgi:hypothetical protein
MSMRKGLAVAIPLACALGAAAVAADRPGLGTPITEADLALWDISIGPTGTGSSANTRRSIRSRHSRTAYLHTCSILSSAWAMPLSEYWSVEVVPRPEVPVTFRSALFAHGIDHARLFGDVPDPGAVVLSIHRKLSGTDLGSGVGAGLERIADHDRDLVPYILARAGRDEDV